MHPDNYHFQFILELLMLFSYVAWNSNFLILYNECLSVLLDSNYGAIPSKAFSL